MRTCSTSTDIKFYFFVKLFNHKSGLWTWRSFSLELLVLCLNWFNSPFSHFIRTLNLFRLKLQREAFERYKVFPKQLSSVRLSCSCLEKSDLLLFSYRKSDTRGYQKFEIAPKTVRIQWKKRQTFSIRPILCARFDSIFHSIILLKGWFWK